MAERDTLAAIRNWIRARLPAVAAAVAALSACVVLAFLAHHGALFRRGGDLDHWQTLVAGLMAIAAALVGGVFVNGQVQLARRQEDERIRRRHAAVRATLPLTLSGLMEYARLCGRALRVLHLSSPRSDVRSAEMAGFELPPVPGDKIAALADVIEASPPMVGQVIARLLSKLQIQDGRLRSIKAEILDPHGHMRSAPKVMLEDFIIDAADLYARCEGLLDYAREASDEVGGEPDRADLRRALTLMSFHEAAFDRLKATVERRFGRIVAAIDVT